MFSSRTDRLFGDALQQRLQLNPFATVDGHGQQDDTAPRWLSRDPAQGQLSRRPPAISSQSSFEKLPAVGRKAGRT